MTVHVAVFRWKEGVDVQKQNAVLDEALDRMAAQIPGLVSFERGGDLGLYRRSFDYALVAHFDGPEALKAYKGNGVHEAVFQTHIAPVLGQQGSVQFEV